jgi:hypothetical protein
MLSIRNYPKILKEYGYGMKCAILKILQTIMKLDLLLMQKIESFSDDLTEFGKNLTANGKVNNPINS